jgi:hypothetical protein
MGGSHGSPESFGSPYSDLVSPRIQHQSREEVTANLSKRFKKATTAQGESMSRGGTAAPLPAAVNSNLVVKHAKIQKKNMERERRRRRAHQREEERLNSIGKPR